MYVMMRICRGLYRVYVDNSPLFTRLWNWTPSPYCPSERHPEIKAFNPLPNTYFPLPPPQLPFTQNPNTNTRQNDTKIPGLGTFPVLFLIPSHYDWCDSEGEFHHPLTNTLTGNLVINEGRLSPVLLMNHRNDPPSPSLVSWSCPIRTGLRRITPAVVLMSLGRVSAEVGRG